MLQHDGAECRSFMVPVTAENIPQAKIYGELCVPAGRTPSAVQVLVHGTTYNHNYWDWPDDPEAHSHVRAALKAGYATFNVDRLGVGQSSKPASNLVTLAATVDTLHQVVAQLRAGAIGGHKFSRVVYFGSSLSTAYGWVEASLHNDVDAFVMTGLLHFTRPTFLGLVQQNLYTVCDDPVFSKSGLDCGYITNRPGSKVTFFYNTSNADQQVIDSDERLKDVASGALIGQSVPLVLAQPPQESPSRFIRVPTLVVLGAEDMTAAGPDGIVCTEETVRNAEAPYYPAVPGGIDVHVVPRTGHSLPLHRNGRRTSDFIMDWVGRHVGA
ncbi:MAG TPA: alpha/beta hydrolase [Xanthobacteraceae bacterium]